MSEISAQQTGNRRRKRPAQRIDKRTGLGKRVEALIRAYSSALGGEVTALQADKVQRAAELRAIAEEARAKAIRGDWSDWTALIKLENAADRALRALNLSHARPSQSFADYVKQRAEGGAS